MLRAVGASVTGPGHLQACQPSQDALSVRGWRGGWIAAVADGLGSKPLSGVGSRLAVQSAQAVFRESGAWTLPDRDRVTAIYQRWLARVASPEPAAYATTLLVAACDAHGELRYLQIGDGLIVSKNQGVVQVITPERTGFGNQTRALGVDRSWSAWTTGSVQLHRPRDFMLLVTDGVSDDIDANQIEGFAEAVHREVAARTRRGARAWLKHEMTHWATPGHTDDKTISMIFRG